VNYKFKPDFGLYSRNLGFSSSHVWCFCGVGLPSIYKVKDDLYSAFLNIKSEEDWYALSLDFSDSVYKQLLQVVPRHFAQAIEHSLSVQPYRIDMGTRCPVVNVTARLGEFVVTNHDESYLPLVIDRFDAAC